MLARLSAFVIWALVAATAVFWGLRLFASAPGAPSYAVAVGDSGTVRSDLSRLLGAAPVNAPVAALTPAASSRFKLLGIVAPKYSSELAPASHMVALIAVDGKMPKAYVVGSRVDGDLTLQSVSLRTVSIGGAGGASAGTITLELPLAAAPATGVLSAPAGAGTYVPPAPSPAPFVQPPPMPAMNPQPVPGFVPPRMEGDPPAK